jgi:hypothetical protein
VTPDGRLEYQDCKPGMQVEYFPHGSKVGYSARIVEVKPVMIHVVYRGGRDLQLPAYTKPGNLKKVM